MQNSKVKNIWAQQGYKLMFKHDVEAVDVCCKTIPHIVYIIKDWFSETLLLIFVRITCLVCPKLANLRTALSKVFLVGITLFIKQCLKRLYIATCFLPLSNVSWNSFFLLNDGSFFFFISARLHIVVVPIRIWKMY